MPADRNTSSKTLSRRVFGAISVHENLTPLHQRVPTTDEHGKLLSDFMMLIPKLNRVPNAVLTGKLAKLQAAIVQHEEVVFADLNLKLNLLWLSFKPRRGLIEQLVLDIQQALPEAKLISGDMHRR